MKTILCVYVLPNPTFGFVNDAQEEKPINPNEELISIGEYGFIRSKHRMEEDEAKR